MRTVLDAVKRGSLNAPLILCAAGIALMLFPGGALSVICMAVGAAIGIAGLIKLYVFFTSGGLGAFFGFDLFGGIALVAASVLLITGSEGAVTAAVSVCGAAIIINGILKLVRIIRTGRQGCSPRRGELVSALLSTAAGLLLILYPVGSVHTVGIAVGAGLLLIGAVYGTLICLIEKNTRNDSYPGVIEGRFTEC